VSAGPRLLRRVVQSQTGLPDMDIRAATEADLGGILEVHNEAVRTLAGLWISSEDTIEGRRAWFAERMAANFPVLVAEADGRIIGFGAYGTYRGRDGYRLTVEHSIYLLPEARGKGAGKALLARLIEIARERGMHAMVAVIDAENAVSIRLHERFGFISAGLMPQLGMKLGTWRDQYQMYLLLDDRPAPPEM